ncbi:MAG: Hsp20/alpha crystallin family protein [Mailhella sp.]|nr:Hsp20/alpha crystallin family protein [Mailhella sp.]
MLPSALSERLFDGLFNEPFTIAPVFSGRDHLFGKHGKHLMKTDVRELDGTYELDIDLPGFKKDEISVDLDDGCLTISAVKRTARDEEKPGQYIRRERCMGECRRTFHVGKGFEAKDVSAAFEDGILRISLPKIPAEKEPQDSKVAIR